MKRFAALMVFASISALTVGQSKLQSLTISPSTVPGGVSTTGIVTLDNPAFTGGQTVALSDNSSAVSTPPVVDVPQGFSSANFTITTSPVNSTATRQVTGFMDGITKTALITLTPGLKNVTVSPSTLAGGGETTGTVNLLGPAPSGGVLVSTSDDSSALNTPSGVSVSAGSASQTFTIGTSNVSSTVTRHVFAAYGGVTRSANITLNPASLVLVGLTLSPNQVVGGDNATGTVTINTPAPVGGVAVSVTDNSSAIETPAEVVVPEGSTSASFGIGTTSVSLDTTRQVSASYGGVTRTVNLTLKPRIRIFTVPNLNDYAYDHVRNKFILSFPGSVPGYGNSLAAVDLVSGAIGPPTFVGSEPNTLGITSGAQFAYVALTGSAAIRRVALATMAAGDQFPLSPGHSVFDMEVVPNQPNSIAAALRSGSSSVGIFMWDNGISRPSVGFGNIFEFSSNGSRAYSLTTQSPYNYNRFHVTPSGFEGPTTTSGFVSQPFIGITYYDGKIFTNEGKCHDAETGQLLGTYPNAGGNEAGGVPIVFPEYRRVYFLMSTGVSQEYVVKGFNMDTFVETGSVKIQGLSGGPGGLLRCGQRSISFVHRPNIYVLDRAPGL